MDKKTGKKTTELSKLPPHLSPFFDNSNLAESLIPKDIVKPEEEDDESIQEVLETSEADNTSKSTKDNSKLSEMLLTKNKKKLLQKIREDNQRKYKKRKIPDN